MSQIDLMLRRLISGDKSVDQEKDAQESEDHWTSLSINKRGSLTGIYNKLYLKVKKNEAGRLGLFLFRYITIGKKIYSLLGLEYNWPKMVMKEAKRSLNEQQMEAKRRLNEKKNNIEELYQNSAEVRYFIKAYSAVMTLQFEKFEELTHSTQQLSQMRRVKSL